MYAPVLFSVGGATVGGGAGVLCLVRISALACREKERERETCM